MMKKLTILAAMLLALCLLGGCTPKDPASETTPPETIPTSAPTEATEPPTMPVDEDVVYFANQPEMNRLYSVRRDGTDLKLVLDRDCYNVRQHGDSVYFMSSLGLEAYHIPTGATSVVAVDPISYAFDGGHLFYAAVDQEAGGIALIHRDPTAGTDVFVAHTDSGRLWAGYGCLYFSCYDLETGLEELKVYHLDSGELRTICTDFYYYGSLHPVEGGAYFEGYSDTQDGWFYISSDGSVLEKQEDLPANLYELIRVSEDGYLYQCMDSLDAVSSSLHFVSADGTDRFLLEIQGSTSMYVNDVADDCWLVSQVNSVGWGEINEYGYHDNYATQVDYTLLDAQGNLTPLDPTGVIGSMFPDGDFPLLDSSTARIPVTSALYEHFVKNYGYEGNAPICSTTHGAWLNIADRKVDLALLAAPTPEEQAYLEEQGVSIEMKLYGGDGLVFIGNAANPVTDLTHEQILAIYRGEITNWSQLGGPDHPIIVYYRDEQSGSQRLFKNLVFKGEEIPDFEAISQQNENFWLWDDMGSIVDMILEEPYAIGYSIMTYLDEVYAEEDMMVFTVDGVLPSPETVKDSSYRYHTQGYLVIRSDEPEDSPARRLYDWFGCPASDDLLNACGVSPLHE